MTDPHAPSHERAYLGVDEILGAFDDGTVTSLSLVDTLLDRIRALDPPSSGIGLRAIAALADDAREVASERDSERHAGIRRGDLHGVPVLVKDNIEVLGLPGTAGSTALIGRPAHDAPLVTSLRDAGAIILGSTNLSQWANIRSSRSTSGWSATGGLVGNPWMLDRSAGGSSSGSGAALAAGFTPLAVGTETDGSIICPASVNGVVGLKPTVGTVSTKGVVPISASQDSPGPMGRTVRDVARLYCVLSATKAPTPDASAARIVFAHNWVISHDAADSLVASTVSQLRSSGFDIVDRYVSMPGPQAYQDELTVMLAELVDDLGTYLQGRPGPGVKSLADVVAYENAHAETELPFFGHDFFDQALTLEGRAGPEYQPARERNLEWAINQALVPGIEGADVIISSVYGPAWKSDLIVGGHPNIASCASMAPAIAGWPVMSLPIGFVHGLPIGLALIARPHDEWRLLDIAQQIEEALAENVGSLLPTWISPFRG